MNLNRSMYSVLALSAALGLGSITALNAADRSAALSAEPAHGSISMRGDEPDSSLAQSAKLSQSQAEHAALQHTPGKVIGTELEEENNFLVWQVTVLAKDGTASELAVDAGNGEVLAMELEDE